MPVAGDRVKALDFSPAAIDEDATQQTNIGTSFAAGSPECGVAFVAPTSGTVMIVVSGYVRDDASANYGTIGWELYTGTSSGGTLTVASGPWEHELRLYVPSGPTGANASKVTVHSGLTAGDDYYIRTVHKANTSGTLDVLMRAVLVVPLPG
jgi:hypothetical protein